MSQVNIELRKTSSTSQLVIWILVMLLLPVIKFMLIKDNYVFYRQLEVFLRVNSDFVPLLFPLLMMLVYPIRFVGEQKYNFLTYVGARITLHKYFNAKLTTNVLCAFFIAFGMVFVPFIFIMYVEPIFGFIALEDAMGNPIPYTTFEQFLPFGDLTYGILYSMWVGLNGALYATFGLLLLMITQKPLTALTTPFIYYFMGMFVTQLLDYEQFSTGLTIFPFSTSQHPLWTVLVPFGVLCVIITGLYIKLRKKVNSGYE
ncbi:ABC transporter permease [Shouchella lonarensis]|uniref:ABC-2 type transport system permease protein n=1 Tax=Shouchella lonarensis TaxID=1464122 RepID=A0A1G6MWS7_9BACI|nr:ABC transporter permease [Shouchella lonarensis]SDC60020.1 hypothetical protein SAMN05421737_11125 [Shouchella lonarensis]